MKQSPYSPKNQTSITARRSPGSCSPARNRQEQPNPAHVLQEMAHEPQSTDILGSYTGTPADGGVPQQDADDL